MGQAGRKRSPGKRADSGRKSRAGAIMVRDYGNVKVQQRHELFRHFIDDKGLVFEGSSAGRLWIVGGFDGYDLDPQVMRDVLLDYARQYWSEWPSTSAVANYTQENRRGHAGGSDTDPRGERFHALDKILRDAGGDVRSAVHQVSVDAHLFPDEDKLWVARIVNSRIVQKRAALRLLNRPIPDELTVAGELACDSDWAMLRLVCLGALALAGGTNRAREGFERRAA